jgi:hypothetical protein
MPALPYQQLLWRMLHERRRIIIRKARGIGLSTYMLYVIAYKILTEFQPGDRVIIITGIRIETAADLIRRLKLLFQRNFPGIYTELVKQKDTICILNGVIVEGYPAGHTDSVRGLDRVRGAWLDECDYWPNAESRAVRSAVEALISKPNSENMYLVLSSTANKPGGLLQTLEQEVPSVYFRMVLTYEYGLEGPMPIYDIQEIERAKSLPSFPSEYEGKYLGLIGNAISDSGINRCILLGDILAKTTPIDNWNIETKYVMSIDIGWGSSNTSIILSRYLSGGKVQIIYSHEYSRSDFRDIIDEVWRLYHKCNGREYLQNILMDASATELYTALCNEFNQNPGRKYLEDKQRWCKEVNTYLGDHLFVCPIAFNSPVGGKYMLNHAQRMIEFQEDDGTAIVGIHGDSFPDLITACRSAYVENERLNKERGVFADSFDSLLMNLSYYRWTK